jgi:hypothetical protein
MCYDPSQSDNYIDRLEEGLHIKGHQDTAKLSTPLSEQAKFNITADSIASATLECMMITTIHTLRLVQLVPH